MIPHMPWCIIRCDMSTITIQYTPDAPDLRAGLQQPLWKAAEWHGDFHVDGRPDAAADPGASFAMLHDARHLYVAIRVTEPAMDRIATTVPGDDWLALASRDCVQLILDSLTTGTSGGFFAFSAGGAGGGLWSGSDFGPKGKSDCTDSIEHAVQRESDRWCVQFSVPLNVCLFGPSSLDGLKFNIGRVRLLDGADAAQRSGYAPPLRGGIFEVAGLPCRGRLERPDRLDPVIWSVQFRRRPLIVMDHGNTACRFEVDITNLNRQPHETTPHFRIESGSQSTIAEHTADPVRIAAGDAHAESFTLPFNTDSFGFLNVTLQDAASAPLSTLRFTFDAEPLGWKEHFIKRLDGKGNYVCEPARLQFMRQFQGRNTCPYGLTQMDNGEILLAGTAWPGDVGYEQTLITISDDRGATWSGYIVPEGIRCRPMMLADLGNGVITFVGGDEDGPCRFFSHDYGRTWPERVPNPPAPESGAFGTEGNPLVERDAGGVATRIAETGHSMVGAYPDVVMHGYLRWSDDGGRTWPHVVEPPQWRYEETYAGKTYQFCGNEGGLVRAANGWLIAALRGFPPARHIEHPIVDDSIEGTFVSISTDDGETWAEPNWLWEGGRHHAALARLPNDDLVMTVVRRVDFRDGRLVSYRRGCDALISHDHGQTWNLDRMIVLDEFALCQDVLWINAECGHLASIALDDGSMLSAYGDYLAGGKLIQWDP